jgi:hypothetical protein
MQTVPVLPALVSGAWLSRYEQVPGILDAVRRDRMGRSECNGRLVLALHTPIAGCSAHSACSWCSMSCCGQCSDLLCLALHCTSWCSAIQARIATDAAGHDT